MKAAEREERNAKALALFVSGATYRQIAMACGLRSTSAAHTMIQKALADSAQRRALLSDEALAIHQERQENNLQRSERLLRAHWDAATRTPDPDHRSAEICRRILGQQASILGQQARLYGLDADPTPLPAPTQPLGGADDDEEQMNDLDRIRARRNTGS